jgi:hypothetical protein
LLVIPGAGAVDEVALEIRMVGLHAGVEHRDLRAVRALVPGARRVDVVVVLLLDRVLLAEAGVVGVLGDGDRSVIFDALHTVAAAQPGAQVFETHSRAGPDCERTDQSQPARGAAAGVADDPIATRVARAAAELHEQTRHRRLLPARLCQAILAERDCGGGRGDAGDQHGHRSEHEKAKPRAHNADRTT